MSGIEHVRIERLDVDNYATWSTRIRLLLVSRGLWTAVKGQLSAGSEADSKADEQALALIGLSVNDHHLTTIASCETAKQAWDALEAVYQAKSVARRLQLKRTLNSLRKEPNEELSKYVARAKDIRDQLAAAGWSPDDQEVTLSILAGLPSEYDTLVTVLMASDVELDPDGVLAKLLTVEQRTASEELAAGDSTSAYVSRQRGSSAGQQSWAEERECYYCGKKGHLKKECRKKRQDDLARGRLGGGATPRTGLALTALATTGNGDWVLDSGASEHITNNLDAMFNVRPASKDVTITFGNGKRATPEAIGDVDISGYAGVNLDNLTLKDVWYVPGAAANLFSIPRAAGKGAQFIFRRGKCEVWKDSLLVADAVSHDGVYSLRLEQHETAKLAAASPRVRQHRYQHHSFDNPAKLQQHNMASGVSASARRLPARSLGAARAAAPVPGVKERQQTPWELTEDVFWGEAGGLAASASQQDSDESGAGEHIDTSSISDITDAQQPAVAQQPAIEHVAAVQQSAGLQQVEQQAAQQPAEQQPAGLCYSASDRRQPNTGGGGALRQRWGPSRSPQTPRRPTRGSAPESGREPWRKGCT